MSHNRVNGDGGGIYLAYETQKYRGYLIMLKCVLNYNKAGDKIQNLRQEEEFMWVC